MARTNRLPLDRLAPYLLDLPASRTPRTSAQVAAMPLSWPKVFGNDHPVEMEIGFGKGLFLLTAARANPGVNYLGVEILRKYQLFAANRIAKRELQNVRLACADARVFLRDFLGASSVRAVHVYFPDPWWKKRHEKRRLFTSEFAAQCERVLQSDGRLFVVSDVEDYFQLMRRLLSVQTGLREVQPPEPGTPADDLDYLTNFERKFRKEGRPIWRCVYERG